MMDSIDDITCLGIYAGIGSMLLGAKQSRFAIIGNIEKHPYYRVTNNRGENTFTQNIKGTWLKTTLTKEMIDEYFERVSLVVGQPETKDVPLFLSYVHSLMPKFFVVESSFRALSAVPIEKWIEALPEYHLYPESVYHFYYGNIQKNLVRLVIVGALKTEKFVFVANEKKNDSTLDDFLDISIGVPNHEPFFDEAFVKTQVTKRGCPSLCGDRLHINHATQKPFTLRERARIQGFPDTFKIYGTVVEPNGKLSALENLPYIKQTGDCCPVQFAKYISGEIFKHIMFNGRSRWYAGNRITQPHKAVVLAKKRLCKEGVYGKIQERVCGTCCCVSDCGIKSCKMGNFDVFNVGIKTDKEDR